MGALKAQDFPGSLFLVLYFYIALLLCCYMTMAVTISIHMLRVMCSNTVFRVSCDCALPHLNRDGQSPDVAEGSSEFHFPCI